MEEGKVIVDQKILQMMLFTDSFRVERDFIVSIDQDTANAIMQDEINVRIEKMMVTDLVAADHEVVTFRAEWPETTWQTFKFTHRDSWWMRWFVKRYPIRMKDIREDKVVLINRYLAYPEAVIKSTQLGKPFIFENVTVLNLDD